MTWYAWVIAALVVLIASLSALLWLINRLRSKEPYASLLALRTRDKIRFFRLLVADKRVPIVVKLIPLLLVVYLLNPVDLIPDFVPVLGYLDDVGIVVGSLALVVRLTPIDLVCDLVARVKSDSSPS
ncbi:MAG: DUF1232 domain-containing protein [Chloroflexi bacterium]|nr:DUF1232 domain-containing protein [Chloroflexota bacterium]